MNASVLDDPSAWIPHGESSSEILNDTVTLIGVICTAFAYGIVFALYCVCAPVLYRRTDRKKQARFMLVYITILTICGALYVASVSREVQMGYVNFRNYPLGPYRYTYLINSTPENMLGVASYVFVIWMTDAVLIWRVFVLYHSKRYLWLVITVPCVLFIASVVLGVIVVYEQTRPYSSWFVSVALAYYISSLAVTITSTILLITRISMARRQFVKAVGRNSPHTKQYLSIMTMLIESSALYGIWSALFIVLYVIQHPMQQFFVITQADIAIIALFLIIFRVSRGNAWNSDTEKALTTIDWRCSNAGQVEFKQ